MNFAEIEKLRSQIASLIPRISGMPKVILLNHFYYKLLSTYDATLIDAFCNEFIIEHLNGLEEFFPHFVEPQKTEDQINLVDQLLSLQMLSDYQQQLNSIKNSIIVKRDKFLEQLKRNDSVSYEKGELYFPLIGSIYVGEDILKYSSIEMVKVKISPAKEKDSFVVVPSNKKNNQLEEQAKTSFELAKLYLKENNRKICKHHEVLIYFENLSAEYDGNSLGLALTIGFIERLSLIYNLPYIIHIKSRIASTGGVNNLGKVTSVGANNICCKVETAFYSYCESLIIPEADEIDAKQKLNDLKEKYPSRLLRLIPVESLTDLLERRNLVDIKKQSHIVRTTRSIKKNWVASFLLLLLTLILIFFLLRKLDDNPYMYEQTENEILIKNKSGTNLWNIKFPNNIEIFREAASIESYLRILDVNDDGINEVLFQFDLNSYYSDTSITNGLALFDSKGNILWRRNFRKHLASRRENLTPLFSIDLFDTLRVNNELCILCGSNNKDSYASAAYILNLKKNKIVSDTLWNSGHIPDIRIADLDSDRKRELVFLTCNNGYKNIALFHLKLDDLKGQAKTTDEYRFYNIKDVKTLHYFLLPNSDYNQYLNLGYSSVRKRGLYFNYESKTIRFNVFEAGLNNGNVIYNWDYSKNDFELAIGNDLQLHRDSLVRIGKLSYPYTDTKEYRELLRSQILAWDGNKFIPIDEWKNKRAAN